METDSTIAYFSMEIALEVGMPTYSGGLGVLAGDTMRSAADLNIPMVAVTLLHRQGYFSQRLDARLAARGAGGLGVDDFVQDMPRERGHHRRAHRAPPRLAIPRARHWGLHRAGVFFGC